MDVSRANTQLDNDENYHGYSWRTQYIKDLPESGTSVSVSYDVATPAAVISTSPTPTRRTSAPTTACAMKLSSPSASRCSLVSACYASGSQQKYWDRGGQDKNLSIGLRTGENPRGVSYNLSGQFTDSQDSDNDRTLSLSLERTAGSLAVACAGNLAHHRSTRSRHTARSGYQRLAAGRPSTEL